MDYKLSRKTIKRWWQRFEQGDWDFRDLSTRPHKLNTKISNADKQEVVELRRLQGYSDYQIKRKLEEKGIFYIRIFHKKNSKICGIIKRI